MRVSQFVAPRNLKANDAYTFLIKELEKVDEKILEPLSGTEWPRDMPVITGGGLIDNITAIDVTYASSGGEEDNLINESANDIPTIQADFNEQVANCFIFAEYMVFSKLESEKMMQVGRNPEDFLNKGIRLHFDKYVDKSVYKGFTRTGSTGLVNNPNITRASVAPHTAGGTDTQWAVKTADEILNDINDAITRVWQACDCSPDGLPNEILIPIEQFGALVTRKVGDDSGKSILQYVKENNIVTMQGQELNIFGSKWCQGVGSGNTDRMVVYANRVDRICFNLTKPLSREETELADLKIKIPYVGQFSEVRFLYPSTVRYADGI